MPKQIQRRFLLTRRPDLTGCSTPVRMIQGYFETKSDRSARVRLIDNSRAELTIKNGRGVVPEQNTRPITLQLARHLLDTICSDSLIKYRYIVDEWSVDVFNDTLTGLVIAELTLDDPATSIDLPEWLKEGVEVTDNLTNHQLARLGSSLASAGRTVQNPIALAKRPKRIVITGAPCSGKSTAIKTIRNRLGHRVHCLPEVATILISLIGYQPTQEYISVNAFQRQVFTLQKQFEQAADEQCRTDSKEAVITDRGSLDGAAYLSGGAPHLERLCGMNQEDEKFDYDAILVLAPPSREVYDSLRSGNPARSEDFDAAVTLNEKLLEAWSSHPRVIKISDFPSWEEKEDTILKTVTQLLDE